VLKSFLVGTQKTVFSEGRKIFWCQYDMLFLTGVVQFFLCGVLLTKEKVVHKTLCMTYEEKKRPKTPSTLCFWGECFSSSVPMYAFLCGNTTSVIFSKQHTDGFTIFPYRLVWMTKLLLAAIGPDISSASFWIFNHPVQICS
jgi:hypothetical protein